MPTEIANHLIELVGIISIGIMTLAGIRIWRGGRQRRDEVSQQEIEQLTDTVRSLQEQLDGMQRDMMELGERLDFAERVLTQPKRYQEPVAESTPV